MSESNASFLDDVSSIDTAILQQLVAGGGSAFAAKKKESGRLYDIVDQTEITGWSGVGHLSRISRIYGL